MGERLTESNGKMPLSEIRRILERGEWWDNVRDVSPDEPCPWLDELNGAIEAALNKLADYEDAEEQGRIVTLPCPLGERVYAIDIGHCCEFPDADTTCEASATYRACEYCANGKCEAPPYSALLETGVCTKPLEYADIPKIGSTVFLTAKEAEAALQAREEAQQTDVGEWRESGDGFFDFCYCSRCGHKERRETRLPPLCPSCGARMKFRADILKAIERGTEAAMKEQIKEQDAAQ